MGLKHLTTSLSPQKAKCWLPDLSTFGNDDFFLPPEANPNSWFCLEVNLQ